MGAGLLAKNDNAVYLNDRGAPFASKPAPTGIAMTPHPTSKATSTCTECATAERFRYTLD
ncbi:hypothetical protein C1884_03745 [Pseudomonas sp. GW460-R15]|nr:hypothetical protein C1887_04170 [Pseudomonas sp. GW456-R21]POA70483.1 hypothetical protein C1884_03745 [Pseudomonas sp. GW460-R15]